MKGVHNFDVFTLLKTVIYIKCYIFTDTLGYVCQCVIFAKKRLNLRVTVLQRFCVTNLQHLCYKLAT
jgi:hypothetical protein